MPLVSSREIRLTSRPHGTPTAENFSLEETLLPALKDKQVLVRNLFMSVDPYMRGRMNDTESYLPPFEVGKVMDGSAVGEVVESRSRHFKAGDAVVSNCGWREYFVASPKELRKVRRHVHPLSVYLGALGMTGMTAWVGLRLAKIKAGDVVYISGAAGAVGSVAGQLAKANGCRVIGSAGSPEKVHFLKEKCGLDLAFDYKDGSIRDQLGKAAPTGIDVYFDNVGGESLEAAISCMNVHGRIICCGAITGYNAEEPTPGPSNLALVIGKRLSLQGMLVRDWLEQRKKFEKQMRKCLIAGNVKNTETVVTGIDHAVDAFLGLFAGRNTGKMVVALA
jgi:NADPH-dependent curcumin reductase CurA